MKKFIGAALLSAAITIGLSPSKALAHDDHFIHDIHGVFSHSFSHSGLQPYICDVDGDIEDQDFTAQYARDGRRNVLQVNIFQRERDFDCDNAGGVSVLGHSVPFRSISFAAKRNGPGRRDVFVQFFIDGDPDPFFDDLTDADSESGPDADGYTTYTYLPRDLAGSRLNEVGFSVELDDRGFVNIDNYRVNGSALPKILTTAIDCPWSDPNDCED